MDQVVLLPPDLFLSPDLTEVQARAYLQALGFRDPVATDDHFQQMADDPVVRQALGRLAPDLIPALLESPDPDAAVAGLSQYLRARSGRVMFLDYLRDDPRALHVATYVLGASPALSEILVRTPEYFHWLVAQLERSAPDRQDHEEELASAMASVGDPADALDMLRRWKRRETLRIGTRDLLRRETVHTVGAQLSDLASVAVDFALAVVTGQLLEAEGRSKTPGAFAVLGGGALGGQELTYAAPIDLLYVYEPEPGVDADTAHAFFVKAASGLTTALTADEGDGPLYAVASLPGQAGGWLEARSLAACAEHLAASTDPVQSAVLGRARPIAGDVELGRRLVERMQAAIFGRSKATPVGEVVDTLTNARAAHHETHEIECVTCGFQLHYGAAHPALRQAGTASTLNALGRAGLIDDDVRRELDHAFVFLRSAEHRRELGLKDTPGDQLASSRARVREIVRSLIHA
jgi:glutamate-ammonia-ligase adenylyltransferase